MTTPGFVDKQGHRLKDYEGTTSSGKYVACGTFFCFGKHGRRVDQSHKVIIPQEADNIFALIQVSISMLSAPGGDFDENDTIFADINEIDGRPVEGPYWKGNPNASSALQGNLSYDGAGVWGHHFGDIGWMENRMVRPHPSWLTVGKNHKNMGVSTFLGDVAQSVTFRLSISGDDWAGANYLIMEL